MATAYGASFVAGDKAGFGIVNASQIGLDLGESDRSVSFWVNPTSASALGTVFNKGGGSAANPGWWCYVHTTRAVRLAISNGATITTFTSTALLTLGQWTHVCLTLDRDGLLSMFFNGGAAGTFDVAGYASAITSAYPFLVGAYDSGGASVTPDANWLNGSLANLDLHNRLYTPSDIALLYNSGRLRPYSLYPASLKSGLVSHWALNGGGGVDGAAFDSTHNAPDSHGSNHLSFAAANIIDATTLNGGFETAGAGGADVFGSWTEGASGGSSVNRDTGAGVPYAGSACCRMDIDANNASAGVTQYGFTVGRLYTYGFRGKSASGTPTMRVISNSAANAHTLSTSWEQYAANLRPDFAGIGFNRLSAASNSIFLDNITLAAAEIPAVAGPEVVSPAFLYALLGA